MGLKGITSGGRGENVFGQSVMASGGEDKPRGQKSGVNRKSDLVVVVPKRWSRRSNNSHYSFIDRHLQDLFGLGIWEGFPGKVVKNAQENFRCLVPWGF